MAIRPQGPRAGVGVDAEAVDRATQDYLNGRLPLDKYEELLDEYVPTPDTLIETLHERRKFVTRLAKRLKRPKS